MRLRSLALLVALCALLTTALGAAKLELQKRHPPPFAADGRNQYEGYVAIDLYAVRAELVRDALAGEPGAWPRFGDFLREDLHPTALTVSVAAAVVSFATGSIPIAFALVTALCTLGFAAAAGALARALAPPEHAARAGLLAAVLALSHQLAVRTNAQLVTDNACALFLTLVVLQGVRWSAERAPRTGAALLATIPLALFTKTSCLPALGLPALATLVGRRPLRVRGLAVDALLFGAVPLALVLAFVLAVGVEGSGSRDFTHLAASAGLRPGKLLHFALEMALLFQALPLLAWWGSRRGPDRPERVVFACLGVLLLATWVIGLPPVPRLYLPAVPLLAALVGARLARRAPSRTTAGLVLAVVATNYGLAVAGLAVQVSRG